MWSTLLPHNEHWLDRALRIVLGISLLAMVGYTAWGWVGLLPLLTGILGRCPAYALFGVSTCGHHPRKRAA